MKIAFWDTTPVEAVYISETKKQSHYTPWRRLGGEEV
jgi:hypothetical protein